MSKLDKWKGFVPDEELATYAKATFGNRIGIGTRPALVNVDTTYMFVDPEYPLCGAPMPEVLAAIERITNVFRALDLPIYYTRRDDRTQPVRRGIFNLKMSDTESFKYKDDPRADEWPASYGPRQQDVVIHKNKPSAFFGTMLESWLRYEGVDTVIIIGVSTSGCVRASLNDAFAHNFRGIVVEDACGDRSPRAHKANLFDIDMKFGDVETNDYVIGELERRFRRSDAAKT